MSNLAVNTEQVNSKNPQNTEKQNKSRLAGLSLAALGIVFGDIATSPIYALRECFYGEYGIAVNQANVMGILSLMFWALVLIVGWKYLIFVFRADNRGEGGVIALTALLRGQQAEGRKQGGDECGHPGPLCGVPALWRRHDNPGHFRDERCGRYRYHHTSI